MSLHNSQLRWLASLTEQGFSTKGIRDLVGVPEASPADYRAQADLWDFRQRSRARTRRRRYGWSFMVLFVLATLLFGRGVLLHKNLWLFLEVGLSMPALLAFIELPPALYWVLGMLALGLTRVRHREALKEVQAEQCWLLRQELSRGQRTRSTLPITLCVADWHGRLERTARSWAESLEWELARADEKRTARLYRCFWCYFVLAGLWMRWVFSLAPCLGCLGNLG